MAHDTTSGTHTEPAAWPPPDYRNQWSLFEVRCADARVAAAYAARQNWWLHCWKHVQAEHEHPQVTVVGTPQPPFVEVPEDGRTQAQRYFGAGRRGARAQDAEPHATEAVQQAGGEKSATDI